ncbi:MAG: TolA-binding protein /TolA-binding protein /Tetratricopeptide (TPR) repeat/TolA-binding protein [Verrucomicrobia bacterium]|nr:MAG: TolA-binding protein /TolA-binding protein /Tetratricopeptide (TPR) repeat/TolA-binding protein [Verrucomicrobiota bacterium]
MASGALLVSALLGAPLQAQSPVGGPQAAELYVKAMTAFASSDFSAAITSLEEMLKLGVDGPAMESVHFSLAAAHFNTQAFPKAKAAFENYLKLYPAGTKATDALLGIAQCQKLLGEKEKAAATFDQVAQKGGPAKEQALFSKATLLKETGNTAEAAKTLQSLLAGGLKTPESVQAALLLSSVEAERGERTSALKILEQLQGRLLNLVENPLQLNALAFEIGDAFLHAFELKQALLAYSMVRRKEDIVSLQQQRIQSLVRRMEANVAAAKLEPSRTVELTSANGRLKAQYDIAKQALDQTTAAPDLLFPLRARQASAYQETGRLEEAILLFESILLSPDKAGREDTLLNLGSLYAKAGETSEAVRVLTELLSEFPKTKSNDTALFLLGTQQLQLDKPEPAAASFEKLLKQSPKSSHVPTALFLLANVRFAQSSYKDALAGYQTYLKSFPAAEFSEEAQYRVALSHFFAGEYAPALEKLETYSKEHTDGSFAADAAYRIAACYQAARKSEEVVRRCALWEASYGDHPISAEVLTLHGDALTALNRQDESIQVYRKATLRASSDEVSHYALFEANKQLQKLGRIDESAEMFQEFLAAKPQHPSNVLAMYWIAKAMHKSGKTDAAKDFLREKIASFINDRTQDAVEQLLSQLAQLCLKAPRSNAPPASTELPPPPHNPEENLNKYLDPSQFPDTPLTAARLLYARAELARMLRKPAAAAAALDAICDKTPPKTLGAALLAQSGDRLLERQETKRAAEFYTELIQAFPKSEMLDYAYNGRGQLALLENKPEEALHWFTDAIDKAGASTKLREVTLGRAKTLLLLGKPDEAKPILEQVASTREWRGECTAEAVFLLGEILVQKGDLPGAIQYFQRVFVAYQRYERFVGRAYLRAAECFEQLNEPEKALAHYKELATKPRLASLPETKTAQKRLESKDPK